MKKTKNNIISFPSDITQEEREVEAILFAAEEPLELDTIESRVSKKKNILLKIRLKTDSHESSKCVIPDFLE